VATDHVEKPPTPTMVSNPRGTIIYTCQVDKNTSHDQICKINPDGSGFVQLTDSMQFQHFYPSWSPDGRWLAFMSYRDNFWLADGCDLYVMRIDGSEIRRITINDYCDYQPRWGS
jgi:TolB protein